MEISNAEVCDDELFRKMLDGVAEAILLIENGLFTYCNTSAVAMFGANSREYLIGKPLAILSPPIQPDGRTSDAKAEEKIREVLNGNAQKFTWVHSRLDGEPFFAEVTLTAFNCNGRIFIQASIVNIDMQMSFLEDIGSIVSSVTNGDLNVRIPLNNYHGRYLQLGEKFNYLIEKISEPIRLSTLNLQLLCRGDIPDQITSDFQGEFNDIKENWNLEREILLRRNHDLETLEKAIEAGNLDIRFDALKYSGNNRRMIELINNLINDFQVQVKQISHYINEIGSGQIPSAITGDFKGDFFEIKTSLEKSGQAIHHLLEDIDDLSSAMIQGRLLVRSDISRHEGDFRHILKGFHETIDILVYYLEVMPVPLLTLDKDMNILYINKAGQNVTGKPLEKVINTKCYSHFKTSDCQTRNCACTQAYQKGTEVTCQTDAHPCGNNLEIQYTGVPIMNKEGEVISVFEFIQDQTGLTRLNRYLQSEVEKLSNNLFLLSSGETNLDFSKAEADEHTKKASEYFQNINERLEILTHTITDVVSDLNTLTHAALDGQLTKRADSGSREGIFREIIDGINTMVESVVIPVQEAIRISGEYGKCNFTARFNPTMKVSGSWADFAASLTDIGIQVSNAIQLVNEKLNDLSGQAKQVEGSICDISQGAQQIAINTSIVSTNADRGENGINQIIRALQDLSSTVGNVANRAEKASNAAENATSHSKNGIQLAKKSESSMNEIIRTTDQADQFVKEINQQMEEIGKIVRFISDIASQTNLLALNAAIEAARAGEAGRGFAVVASEVKSLAQDSRKSAENIASMITVLQKKAKDANEAMTHAGETVSEGKEILFETLGAFNQIARSIEEISSSTEDVSAASQQQAASVEELTASMQEVSQQIVDTSRQASDTATSSEETAAAIEQINTAIFGVNENICKISQEMTRFKVIL